MNTDRSAEPLTTLFEVLDDTEPGQGACSLRVQQIINVIHGRSRSHEAATDVRVGDPVTTLTTTERLFPLTKSASGWQLFAKESGKAGSVRQDIHFAKANLQGQWEGFPVFTLLERANDDGCSVALCVPAALEDLEWGVVATKADEARPVTVDESLESIPQTNAKILDMLSDSVQELRVKPELVEPLHIEVLFDRVFPAVMVKASPEFATLVLETRRTRLAKEMAKIGVWSALDRRPIVFTSDTMAGEHLKFSQLDQRVASVERVITNRGTAPKVAQLGHVVVANERTPVFIPDNGLEKLFDQSTIEEIMTHAEAAYDIPETISSPKLTEAINNMIADLVAKVPVAKHAKEFNKRLGRIFNQQLPLIQK